MSWLISEDNKIVYGPYESLVLAMVKANELADAYILIEPNTVVATNNVDLVVAKQSITTTNTMSGIDYISVYEIRNRYWRCAPMIV